MISNLKKNFLRIRQNPVVRKHIIEVVKKRILRKKQNLAQYNYTIDLVRPDAKALAELKANNYLAGYARNISSQGGEDGVIEQIFKTIGLTSANWCVEFGACDGKVDSNSWNLVKNHGWKAVYVEPNQDFFKLLKAHCDANPGTWCFDDMVGWEGDSRLDAILARTPIPAEFGFISIDVDGPDYYIWEALEEYRPHVVCIEFNRLINPKVSFIPTKESFLRPSSLRALYALGKRKGYELVSVVGWNAFFVRSEHFPKFNIVDNCPEKLFYPEDEMRIFQGYDGTLFLHPVEQHYWRFQYNDEGVVTPVHISQRDIQVLPDGLRVFRPRHTYRSVTLEKQAGKLDSKKLPRNILLQYRKNVVSENGEDGILEHICKKAGIKEGFCVDVGAGDGRKWSNSWNLVANHGWKGLLIESDNDNFAKLKDTYKDNARAQYIHEYATSRNIEALLRKHNVPKKFDILTIDVEGNDYHVFAGLKSYKPTVVVIDFNPSIANDIRFIQEENRKAHYGSSLAALTELAVKKGYKLAAVTDWNAIFVRDDIFNLLGVPENSIDEMYYPPFEMRMFQTLEGCVHLAGCDMLVRQDYKIEWEDFQVLPRQLRGENRVREDESESDRAFGTSKSLFY